MNKNTTEPAQVIPFQFEASEVRTLLIDDQPWFCAADVCAVLGYANSRKAITDNCRASGVTASDIRSGGQKRSVTFISEGNLYRLIIKSRKEEAQRFEAWVCDEVLPAIRKHGRYVDGAGKLDTLLGSTIGTNGFNMLGSVIKGKVAMLPKEARRRATMKIWSQTHTAFGVRSAQDIPADQLDAARNFVAAYALEGDWLPKAKEEAGVFMIDHDLYRVWFICRHFDVLNSVQRQAGLCRLLSGLGSRLGAEMIDHFRDGGAAVHVLLNKYGPAMNEAADRLGLNRSTH
ncbi:BRO-N domain-containing protein [Pseudomonas linyingensis]|nr:Bro-N domain-containing protein [Pseudomonas linyingensis]